MIPAELYQWIYFFLVTMMTFIVAGMYGSRRNMMIQDGINDDMPLILSVLFFIFFIGLRPVSVRYFCDMANYDGYYHAFLDGAEFVFSLTTTNKIWDNLFALWGSLRLGVSSWFLLISAIYFGCAYLGIRRLFPEHKLAAYLVFLAAFSTFSYGTNGTKAGAAASIFIFAFSCRRNPAICIPLMLVSWGFHHSMHVPLAVFVLTSFIKNPKIFFYFWIICFLVALAHIDAISEFLAGFTDDTGAEYLLTTMANYPDDYGGRGGFRLDFVLYSVVPVTVGYYALYKKNLQISDTYRHLLCFYLCTNGLWMLCMYANFTNRIAYLSWFVYPMVLIYPYLNENWGEDKFISFSAVMIGHLIFTLFMAFVYPLF